MNYKNIAVLLFMAVVGASVPLAYNKYVESRLHDEFIGIGCEDIGPPDNPSSPTAKYIKQGYACGHIFFIVPKGLI